MCLDRVTKRNVLLKKDKKVWGVVKITKRNTENAMY